MTKLSLQEVRELHGDVMSGLIGVDCEVALVTYTGTQNADPLRRNKNIHMLTSVDANGDEIVILVGDKGKSGPSMLKEGRKADIGKLKTGATFNLRNGGYTKIETQSAIMSDSRDLWARCFKEHHNGSDAAKTAFLKLIGMDLSDRDSHMPIATPASRGVKPVKAPPPPPPNPYADNPIWGTL